MQVEAANPGSPSSKKPLHHASMISISTPLVSEMAAMRASFFRRRSWFVRASVMEEQTTPTTRLSITKEESMMKTIQ